MTSEEWFVKDEEGCGGNIVFRFPSRQFSEGAEENHENIYSG
jgi:hypothetical protein